jgi:hypothetical protein
VPSEADALARLRETSDAIVAGVEAALPAWTVAQVHRILDAWGRADQGARRGAELEAASAGPVVAARVGAELRALFALDPADMRATPLEIVRTATREPTAILAAAGVPPVERDEFAERSWPDDRYGLTPATLGDLAPASEPTQEPARESGGGGEFGPLQLAWGLAKVGVLRARAGGPPSSTNP